MANEYLARLRGTFTGIFQLAKGGVNLKNSSGDLQVRNAADSAHANIEANAVKIKDSGSANMVIFQAPTLGANVTYTLPDDDGTPGQFLQTNGSGVLDWVDSISNADLTWDITFTEADTGTLAMFTPPANCTVHMVEIETKVAAGASTPTIKVGVVGSTARYIDTTENDLKTVGIYMVHPEYEEDGTPEAIIATIADAGQTFTGRIRLTFGNPT